MSQRRDILEAVLARLGTILTSNGFATDAGGTLFLGAVPELGPDDPSVAVAIIVGDDAVTFQGENMFIALPLHIAAVAKADLDEPWIAVEDVLSDIKKAIELTDRTLGGLVQRQLLRGTTRTVPRDPGSLTVGVAVEYRAPYREAWGNP